MALTAPVALAVDAGTMMDPPRESSGTASETVFATLHDYCMPCHDHHRRSPSSAPGDDGPLFKPGSLGSRPARKKIIYDAELTAEARVRARVCIPGRGHMIAPIPVPGIIIYYTVKRKSTINEIYGVKSKLGTGHASNYD